MAGLPFTNLKDETDIAILAVLRACRLYVYLLVEWECANKIGPSKYKTLMCPRTLLSRRTNPQSQVS
jgi:hypothetical protein